MSNLYLYTFLATLLLLLAISVLIVGRSIFIRRRARRMMEEGIRNGTFPPQSGRPVARFGAKPKLFDVYTTRNGTLGQPPLGNSSLTWEHLKPLSTTVRRSVSLPPRAPVSQPPSVEPPSLLFRLAPRLRPTSRAVTPDSSAHPLETRQQIRSSTLTVSVMIAMPTPTLNPLNLSEDMFPPVQVGITHIPLPHGWTADTKPQSA